MENTRNNSILIAVILLIVIAAILFLVSKTQKEDQTQSEEDQVVCTMEAKLCPDGSYVGRVPPLCEFSPCPTSGIPDK